MYTKICKFEGKTVVLPQHIVSLVEKDRFFPIVKIERDFCFNNLAVYKLFVNIKGN